MQKIKKTLNKGTHVLSIPSGNKLSLKELFPKEISGSTIEKLNSKGNWHHKEVILYENSTFNISDNYKAIYPLQTIRLVLKRSISIEWDIDFTSHSGLRNTKLVYENGFNAEEALFLAQLSELAYLKEKEIKKIIADNYHFDNFHYHSKHSHGKLSKKWLNLLFVFFRLKTSIVDLQFVHFSKLNEKTGKNLIIFVFKGSQEPQDWITNFDIKDVKFDNHGNVHKGFNQTMKLFFKVIKKRDLTDINLPTTLLEDIKNINENSKILLTGHSLGGAIATIVGCHLHKIGIKKENFEIYTFGSPPVGTEDFSNYYNDKINLFRLVNKNDIIPKLEKILKFFHFGTEIILPSNDGEIHSCKDYIDNIIDKISFDKL